MPETEVSFNSPATSAPTPTTGTPEGFFAKTQQPVVVVEENRAIIPAPPQDITVGRPQETSLATTDTASAISISETGNDSAPNQNEIIDKVGEVIDDTELIFQLNAMMANPGLYTQEQVTSTMKKGYGGASLETIRNRNPQLAETLQKAENYRDQQLQDLAHIFGEATQSDIDIAFSEAAASDVQNDIVDAEIIPDPPELGSGDTENTATADIPADVPGDAQPAAEVEVADENAAAAEMVDVNPDTITNIQRTSEDTLDVTVTDPVTKKEKHITFTQVMAATFFILTDLAFFHGSHTYMLAESLISPLTEKLGGKIMARMGMEIPQSDVDRDHSYELFLNEISTEKLVRIFERFHKGGVEMFRFLSSLKETDRHAMLKGERFGGALGRHKLRPEEIKMVEERLTPEQALALGITLPAAA